MNRASNRRAEYSPEQRAALVREFRSSGETQQAFARRHRIKGTTFRNWLYPRKAKRRPAAASVAFQEIRVTPLNSPLPWDAEISMEGGTVVRLRAGADPRWVQSIIQPLRQPC